MKTRLVAAGPSDSTVAVVPLTAEQAQTFLIVDEEDTDVLLARRIDPETKNPERTLYEAIRAAQRRFFDAT